MIHNSRRRDNVTLRHTMRECHGIIRARTMRTRKRTMRKRMSRTKMRGPRR